MRYYRLDATGVEPVPEKDNNFITWSQWFESAVIHVAKSHIGNIIIETKFIGFTITDSPELWQTEIRGSPMDGRIYKCTGNRHHAEHQHDEVTRLMQEFVEKQNQKPDETNPT